MRLTRQDVVVKPLGIIPLEGCEISTDSTKIKKPLTFELLPSTGKIFYIQCNSQEEMDDWIKAITDGKNFYTVSQPYDLNHNVHVDGNSETGFSVRIPSIC